MSISVYSDHSSARTGVSEGTRSGEQLLLFQRVGLLGILSPRRPDEKGDDFVEAEHY